MRERTHTTLGMVIAITGALLGILGTLMLFTRWYEPVMAAELAAGREDEKLIVQYIFPALSDIGVLAGVLWAVAAYGFGTRRSWAWSVGIIANVMALQSSFFPMIPPVTRDLPPITAPIFIPNLIFFVLMLRVVRQLDWHILIVGLLLEVLLYSVFSMEWGDIGNLVITTAQVGEVLFNEYGVAVLMLGLLLLSAIMGGVFIAQEDDDE